jgi:nicotinamide riboside transporter PnuC
VSLLWLVSIASILGVVLNIRRNALCFLVWTATNAIWFLVDVRAGIPEQAVLHLVYFALALWGLYAWTRDDHRRGAAST